MNESKQLVKLVVTGKFNVDGWEFANWPELLQQHVHAKVAKDATGEITITLDFDEAMKSAVEQIAVEVINAFFNENNAYFYLEPEGIRIHIEESDNTILVPWARIHAWGGKGAEAAITAEVNKLVDEMKEIPLD